MKNQTVNKQARRRHQRHEESRKSSLTIVNTLIKKINRSIPMNMPTKSVLLNSHRNKPKIQSIKIPNQSQQITASHSRKASMQSGRIPASGRTQQIYVDHTNKDILIKKDKEHNRSNSTISKKSNNDIQNCFKIDISKLLGKNENENRIIIEPKQIGRVHFDYNYVIGKGGFGKVWSVEFKKNKKIYAMKQMLKSKIIGKKSIHSVLNERQLLEKLKHPFIVNMSYAFQDRQSLYLVMDLLVGGDLRYHMGCRRRFKQVESKFFIACIILGLQFLHLHNIIHRDIKPQNLVFDDKGYLRITDLGIARLVKSNNNADTSGTPGYMAPEVMCRQDHSFPVDYYAVGVIAYELMLGKRPYNGRNRKQIRDHILSKQVQIKEEDIPAGWSQQAQNFINKMIQRKPNNRLGTDNGILEIKQHAWFKNFPWVQLMKKNIVSPFVPKNILDNQDYRDQISSSSEDQNEQQNQLLLRRPSVEQLFEGYSYYCKDHKEIKSRDKKKKNINNIATTANTHYSYMDEKQSNRGKMGVEISKINNYLKGKN